MSSSSYTCIGDLDDVMQGINNLEKLTYMWNNHPGLSAKEISHQVYVTYSGEMILKVMICNKQ